MQKEIKPRPKELKIALKLLIQVAIVRFILKNSEDKFLK